jgi:quercetin dioxygenase-like cupin family protein
MRALALLAAGAVIGAGAAFAAANLFAQTASAQGSQTTAPARPASGSNELFRAALPDMPGKQLVVVPLRFLPGNGPKPPPHQHPGSVFVYVTKGEARLGVEGQAPQVVSEGHGWFEPLGAIHNVNESASPTETATAIAVMIVPDGAALVKLAPADHAGH